MPLFVRLVILQFYLILFLLKYDVAFMTVRLAKVQRPFMRR